MKKLLIFVVAAVLLPILTAGCGSGREKDRGINSNKDMPKADR